MWTAPIASLPPCGLTWTYPPPPSGPHGLTMPPKYMSTIFVSVYLLLKKDVYSFLIYVSIFEKKMSTIFLSVCLLLRKNVYNFCVCVSTFEKKCLHFSCLCVYF